MIQRKGWICKGEFNRKYKEGLYPNHTWKAHVNIEDSGVCYKDIEEWGKENATGLITHFYSLIYFEKDTDAMAFKLGCL